MAKDHALMYVLSSIVLLNIIAIVLLNNRLTEPAQEPAVAPPMPDVPPVITPPEPVVVAPRVPDVRAVVLSDVQRCPDCFDISQYAIELNKTVLLQVENGTGAFRDEVLSAARLLNNSDRLPMLAFNSSLANYPQLIDGWNNVGFTVTIRGEQWYVLPTLNAPYYDLNSNMVRGRVTVTYLTMRSCATCYDVYTTRTFLNNSHITPYRENVLDAESAPGKALIAKYNITNVPTIILSPEVDEYPNLRPGWPVVGTIEQDGSYVLRNLQRLGVTYYDVELGKVMVP